MFQILSTIHNSLTYLQTSVITGACKNGSVCSTVPITTLPRFFWGAKLIIRRASLLDRPDDCSQSHHHLACWHRNNQNSIQTKSALDLWLPYIVAIVLLPLSGLHELVSIKRSCDDLMHATADSTKQGQFHTWTDRNSWSYISHLISTGYIKIKSSSHLAHTIACN